MTDQREKVSVDCQIDGTTDQRENARGMTYQMENAWETTDQRENARGMTYQRENAWGTTDWKENARGTADQKENDGERQIRGRTAP
ncbi:hypothetical protein KY289_009096 [Solanum tuberosum]|nr:hypothetical protein KY289_009096 [Solanum tuberosum]KAH0715737.1 hypothetical protein KY284_008642 [Solanum tuberosum]